MRHLARALVLLALISGGAHAQKQQKQQRPQWKAIGNTVSGNTVYVDPRTVRRDGSLVHATVRIVFTTPVETPKGAWMSSRTTATFDCAKKLLAAKENVYFGDARETKVVDRKVNKIPGYGPAIGGSLGDVSMKYLCAAR